MTVNPKKSPPETWQFQEAKAKLSEVFDRAEANGPQRIQRRGKKAMILLDEEEFMRLRQRGMTVAEALSGAPEELPYVRDNRPVIPMDLE